jgi:TonB family protein
MKKPFLIMLFLSFSFLAKAQNDKTDSVHTFVEIMPHFRNGDFLSFVGKNIRYPMNAFINHVQGKVFVQFIIQKDGSITNATIVRPVSPEIDTEALRVVKSSPKWIPGIQNGRPVSVSFTIPIIFRIGPTIINPGGVGSKVQIDTTAVMPTNTSSDVDLLNSTDPAIKPNDPIDNQIFAAVEHEPSFRAAKKN